MDYRSAGRAKRRYQENLREALDEDGGRAERRKQYCKFALISENTKITKENLNKKVVNDIAYDWAMPVDYVEKELLHED